MDTEKTTTGASSSSAYLIPAAIVIAGIFIAGAIFATNGNGKGSTAVAPTGKTLEATVLPVTADDHVRGPKDPDVYLIEYSDYECPYCERFHVTVQEVLKKYDGKVAWVYRHLPLPMHAEAHPAAVAGECMAELGGEDAFWSYTDAILSGGKALSRETYTSIATGLSIDKTAFETCLDSGKYDALIQKDSDNAAELGGNGTPFTVLLTKNGDILKFSGALPIEQVSLLVERALRSLE
ncbi:MAG: thioredoxin domain-containing protein [Candidatus Pacebacteria bacterium]|nr:thioredoxin domain-containing protein [Candidatus Paceibacterota bacterium]